MWRNVEKCEMGTDYGVGAMDWERDLLGLERI